MKRILLLGCGHKQKPYYSYDTDFMPYEGDDDVVRMDFNPDVAPDYLHDLNVRPFPFKDDEFDEIHAYEVFEHLGRQGDWKSFFDEFTEYHRILKNGGGLIFSCPKPSSEWVWADPSHTREISPNLISFLSQKHYEQCGVNSPCSDYRFYYKADYVNMALGHLKGSYLYYLQAKKGVNHDR